MDQDLQKAISDLYDIEIDTNEKVSKGFLSTNFILSAKNKKFFLKKYRFDTKERIEEIHSVKKYFSDGGIPVIFPLINKEGKTYFDFDNEFFAIFPYISDKQLKRETFTDQAAISLGEMLGRIHLLGKVAKLPIKEKFHPWNTQKALEKIEAILSEIKNKQELTEFDKQALEQVEFKKKLVLENSLAFEDLHLSNDHLTHGDYNDQNVFFDKNDKISRVFDFEKTDYSPRMYELFRCIMYSFLGGVITEEKIKKAKLCLDSYLQIYPASQDELSRGLKLFYLRAVHSFWVEGEHYLKGSNRVDGFLLDESYRVTYLSEHYEEFEKNLLGGFPKAVQ